MPRSTQGRGVGTVGTDSTKRDSMSTKSQSPESGEDPASPATPTPTTPLSHEVSEPLGVQRIVSQPVQSLVLYTRPPRAKHSSQEKREIDFFVTTRVVSHPSQTLVVMGVINLTADTTARFFRTRLRETTTALGSPKMPRMCP